MNASCPKCRAPVREFQINDMAWDRPNETILTDPGSVYVVIQGLAGHTTTVGSPVHICKTKHHSGMTPLSQRKRSKVNDEDL